MNMFYELMLNHVYNQIISKKRQISQTLFEKNTLMINDHYKYEYGQLYHLKMTIFMFGSHGLVVIGKFKVASSVLLP